MASFCGACGGSVAEGDKFCPVCGRDASAGSGAPVGAAAGTAETSPKAILSLVCGLLFFIPFAFVGAIVFGHMGLSQIRKSAGRLKGEGMAIAGLVLGYMWIASIPVVLIIAAIAIPNLLRARMAANESSAVAGVRTLITAEIAYSGDHPSAGYTCALSDLSGVVNGALLSGQKNGYTFKLSDCKPGPGGANIQFRVVAYPITPNTTGTRAFCADESAVIKVDADGSAEGCLQNGTVLQ